MLSTPPRPEQLSIGLWTQSQLLSPGTLPSVAALGAGGRDRARPMPPWGDRASLALSGPGAGGPGLAQHPGTSPCPSETLPSTPHSQNGRRWDLSQPISSLAEQGLYPLLPWQPASFSGSQYCARGTGGQDWEKAERNKLPSRLLGPKTSGSREERTPAHKGGLMVFADWELGEIGGLWQVGGATEAVTSRANEGHRL